MSDKDLVNFTTEKAVELTKEFVELHNNMLLRPGVTNLSVISSLGQASAAALAILPYFKEEEVDSWLSMVRDSFQHFRKAQNATGSNLGKIVTKSSLN